MAFNPSTASPVTSAFDPSTAQLLAFDPQSARKIPQTIEEIRQEATDARKQWQQTGLAPSTTAPVEGTGGAAFGVFASQNRQQRQQNIQVRKEEQKALEIPYQIGRASCRERVSTDV